jgi:hypothetical protein
MNDRIRLNQHSETCFSCRLRFQASRDFAKDRVRGSHPGCGRASAIVQLQAGYMHADRFDITNKKLAKGAGSIQARKGRIPHRRESQFQWPNGKKGLR